ncbi:MAG: hypothetical protein ACOZNI_18045, partial [Myxococcota bacterium]
MDHPDLDHFCRLPIPPDVVAHYHARTRASRRWLRAVTAWNVLWPFVHVFLVLLHGCATVDVDCDPLVKVVASDVTVPEVFDGEVALPVRTRGEACESLSLVAVASAGTRRQNLDVEDLGEGSYVVWVPVREGDAADWCAATPVTVALVDAWGESLDEDTWFAPFELAL